FVAGILPPRDTSAHLLGVLREPNNGNWTCCIEGQRVPGRVRVLRQAREPEAPGACPAAEAPSCPRSLTPAARSCRVHSNDGHCLPSSSRSSPKGSSGSPPRPGAPVAREAPRLLPAPGGLLVSLNAHASPDRLHTLAYPPRRPLRRMRGLRLALLVRRWRRVVLARRARSRLRLRCSPERRLRRPGRHARASARRGGHRGRGRRLLRPGRPHRCARGRRSLALPPPPGRPRRLRPREGPRGLRLADAMDGRRLALPRGPGLTCGLG